MGANTKKTTSKKSTGSKKKNNSKGSARSSSGAKKSTAKRTASSARKQSAGNRSSANRNTQRTAGYTSNPMMNTEVLCWCLLAAAVLIFVCVVGFGGKLGDSFGDLLFGVMGTNAYVFPFLLFFLTIYMTINRGNHVAVVRTLSVIGLFCILCGVWQLLNYGDMAGTSGISDYFTLGKEYHAGGGVIGGALILFFTPTVGVVGTWAVLLIAIFLFLTIALHPMLPYVFNNNAVAYCLIKNSFNFTSFSKLSINNLKVRKFCCYRFKVFKNFTKSSKFPIISIIDVYYSRI